MSLFLFLFFKKITVFFNEDNMKLIRNSLDIVNVVNDDSSWKWMIFNGIST